MANVINWFEIPATDFDRAKKFYADLFAVEDLFTMENDGIQMGFFPMDDQSGGSVGGAVCQGQWYQPSAEAGALLYLNANPNLDTMLGRVETAGGSVMMGKTSIGEHGFMALFVDSEGNRVGLHSKE